MKWHKFESAFWDSETAVVLERDFGPKVLLGYLRIISRIALEIQDIEDINYLRKFGWKKSLPDWSRIARVRSDVLLNSLKTLQSLGKVFVVKIDTNLYQIKFKNIGEFINLMPLSSKMRRRKAEPDGSDKLSQTRGPEYIETQRSAAPALLRKKLRNEAEANTLYTPPPLVLASSEKRDGDSKPMGGDIEKLRELWNLHNTCKIKGFFPKRLDLVHKALEEEPCLEYWEGIFKKCGSSRWLNHSKTKKWKTTFEWSIQNHVKIAEETYDDAIAAPAGGKSDDNKIAGIENYNA